MWQDTADELMLVLISADWWALDSDAVPKPAASMSSIFCEQPMNSKHKKKKIMLLVLSKLFVLWGVMNIAATRPRVGLVDLYSD